MTLGIRQRLNFRAEDVQTWSPECRTWFLNPEENFSAQMLLFWHLGDLKASWNLHYLLFECVFLLFLWVIHQYMMFLRKKRFVACKYVTLRTQNGCKWHFIVRKNTHSCWVHREIGHRLWCLHICEYSLRRCWVSGGDAESLEIVGFKI